MKRRWGWLAPLLPIAFAIILVIILTELDLIEWRFSIHDIDTALIFLGILAAVISGMTLLSRATVIQMERDSLRRAREESDAERSRFLRRLDHELKNPLMAMKLAVANLANQNDSQERQRISEDIDTQIERMTRLVADLRKIAELGTNAFEQTTVDVNSLLQEAFDLACEDEHAESRHLSLSLPNDLPRINGDYDLLVLAFYNLLNNALKFTHPADNITLKAQSDGDELHIEVSDSGVGIAPEDLPYIFDELYRSPGARAIPGSGIGLALVKLIVQRHSGTIEVSSQVNSGTTMRVSLPLLGREDQYARVPAHAKS
ncbi:MAG: HAMP domain-containing histidine kinase [Anaerolineae bacterium]|nr:HAMP domain-containing histidine kinase [Anaerolineae bacterium]